MSERGGVQHSPRVDDAMAAETDDLTRGAPHESRAEDERLVEPLDDEQGSVLTGLHDPAVDDEHVEVVARSELARFLRPSALPADARALAEIARDEGAPDAVLEQLDALPEGTQFATVAQVWEALGHETEHRAHVAPAAPSAPEAQEAQEAQEDVRRADVDGALQESPGPLPGAVRAVAAAALGLARGVLGAVDAVLESVEARVGH